MPLPYTLEQTLLDRKTELVNQFQDGAGVDVPTVNRLLGINNTWPSIAPGAALSFARAGLGFDHPVVHNAARLSVQQTLNKTQWRQTLSGLRTLDDLKHVPQGLIDKLNPDELKQLHNRFNQLADSALSGDNPLATVTGAVGDAASAVTGAASDAVDAVTSNLGQGGNFQTGALIPAVDKSSVQAVTRTAGLAAMAPIQSVQAKVRDVANSVGLLASGDTSPLDPTSNINATTPASDVAQTQAGQAYNAAVAGQQVDVGSGWLPDPNSQTGQAAAAAARAAAPTIGGHAFTFGRFVADEAGQATQSLFGTNVVEPNSDAFNVLSGGVDAVGAIAGDPTVHILKGISASRAAGEVFAPEQVAASNAATTDTGLMPLGTPRDIVQPTKSAWLDSHAGTTLAEKAVAEATGNPSRMIRYFDNKISSQLAIDLADQTDANGFKQVLSDATLPRKLQVGGFGYQVNKTLDSRLLSAMPGHNLVDLADKDMTWVQMDRTLQAAGVPIARRDVVLNGYLRSNNPIEAMDSMQAVLKEQMLAHGASEEVASKTASVFRNGEDFSRSYDVDQATGLERVRPGVIVGGEGYVYPNATADSERLSSMVRFPDGRTLRQLTNRWTPILQHPAVQNIEGAIDGIINTWKTSVVARPTLLTKITLEQQLNSAARGNANLFTHPLAFLSTVVGENADGPISRWVAKLPGVQPAYIFGPNGEPLLEEGQNLLQGSLRYSGQDPGTLSVFGYHNAPITHPAAGDGLAEAIGKMYTDPIFRNIADMTPQEAKDWFWEGDGKATRLARADIVANDDAHNLAKVASGDTGPGAQAITIGDIANDRYAADRYIDEAHYPRIQDLTNGNQELLDAIKTGKLGGHMLFNPTPDGSVTDRGAAEYAKQLLDSGEGPRNVIPVRDAAEIGGKKAGFYNRALDWAFHAMIDVPDAALNRSPAYRQAVWERTAQLLPYVEPGDLPKVIQSAVENRIDKLNPDLMDRLRNVTLDASETPRLSADQITDAAKATALGTDLPKTAHDLTSRTHLFDMLRFMVPFGDAWRLIVKRAAQLVMDEPHVLQRANQALYEVKQPGSSAINRLAGDPVNGNNGFFHTDPLSGDQVFTIPGSTLLTENTLGVPIPLVGQVKGLSMLSDAYPSIGGPGVTLPAKWLLPDTPTGNTIKDIIFPHGSAQSEGVGPDIAQQFTPSWAQKLMHAYPNQHTFNSAFNVAVQTLASTGDYDLNKPEDLQRLVHDAKANAGWIYTIRGAAQFFVPSAPTGQGLIKDKTGQWADATAAVKAFQKQSSAVGPDKAMDWLVHTLGVNNIFVSQAASEPVAYRAPVTKEAQAWVDANPSVASKYPLVYGLFAPAKPGDKFDLSTYEQQFTKGQRVTLTPDQQVAQAENRLGFYAYNRAKAAVVKQNNGLAPDSNQNKWLADYRKQLEASFPGFDTFAASPYDTTRRRASAIGQLEAAATDKTVTATDAGQGLAQYLQARQAAIAQTVAGGGKTPFQSKAGQALRFWLRAQAAEVIAQHPGFQPMWNDVFSREMVDN